MSVPFRIGQGFDVHALVPGRPLIIGGVTIPFSRGLLGHSDADVLLHTITDAILGAAGLGDIGRHFPDTDSRFEGADSRVLLREDVVLAWRAQQAGCAGERLADSQRGCHRDRPRAEDFALCTGHDRQHRGRSRR